MKKVFVLTALLLIGLTLSQVLPGLFTDYSLVSHIIKLGTMLCLSFIMIHVGYEFEIQKNQMRTYGYDYVVAFTAATFPWIFVTLYFVYVLMPETIVGWESWKQSLLAARFAAPTSAGVLFSMLAAAGLAATWMFRKTRILAIFDDLDTVLLMIPLQMLIIGFRWQLLIIVFVMGLLLWLAWRYLHSVNMSITWKSVFLYAVGITAVAELVYFSSKLVDEVVPVHIEVLLPAFVLGTVISKAFNKVDTAHGPEDVLETPTEQRISYNISMVFMILVGLSMPVLGGASGMDATTLQADSDIVGSYVVESAAQVAGGPGFDWGMILFHILIVTLLSNIGKMMPAFVYRNEATFRERLAVAVAMFPRGEVGAGVLIISLSYGISSEVVTVAMLSLALNLILTGLFIYIVNRLLNRA
jgi:hypothetical protein